MKVEKFNAGKEGLVTMLPHPISDPASFPKRPAIYVYTMEVDGKTKRIAYGETGDLSSLPTSCPEWKRASEMGATHVHEHPGSPDQAHRRLMVEALRSGEDPKREG